MTHQHPSQQNDPTKNIGKAMMYLGWLVVLAGLSWFFTHYEKNKINPNQVPQSTSNQQVNEVILHRNAYGHYVSSGTINGKPVTFLLDTGATNVSIPANLANKLDLEAMARGRSSTANGFIDVYLTRIEVLTIGSITAYDVKASINPGMNHSKQILLGMSVLKNVEFTQKGNTLFLRQHL
jgi:aspartyl protease family protein